MRHHLFRLEAGETILDLHSACEASGGRLHIVAVGSHGAELLSIPRSDAGALDSVSGWIARLAALLDECGCCQIAPGALGRRLPG